MYFIKNVHCLVISLSHSVLHYVSQFVSNLLNNFIISHGKVKHWQFSNSGTLYIMKLLILHSLDWWYNWISWTRIEKNYTEVHWLLANLRLGDVTEKVQGNQDPQTSDRDVIRTKIIKSLRRQMWERPR